MIWDFSGFYFIFFCVFMGFLRVFAGSWPDTATNCADPGIDLFLCTIYILRLILSPLMMLYNLEEG